MFSWVVVASVTRALGFAASVAAIPISLSAGVEEQAVKNDSARKHMAITREIKAGRLIRGANIIPPPEIVLRLGPVQVVQAYTYIM